MVVIEGAQRLFVGAQLFFRIDVLAVMKEKMPVSFVTMMPSRRVSLKAELPSNTMSAILCGRLH